MTNSGDRPTLGIVLMVAFAICGPLIDTFGKIAAQAIPVGEIVLARFSVQSVALLPVALLLGALHRPRLIEVARHFARAVLILIATGCFFAAIRFMPIADAISIFFIEPLLLTLLGGFLLGESVGWRRIAACIVGFIGALFVIQPSFEEFGGVALLPLVTALTFAFYMILTRQMARAMHPVTLQAYTAVAAFIIMVPVLWAFDGSGVEPLDPVMPDRYYLMMLLGVGLAATVAHIFISFALRYAPSATIAPLQYLEIVSATVLGLLVFGDFPDGLTFLGIAIIVGSGLYVFFREQALSAGQARVPLPPPTP